MKFSGFLIKVACIITIITGLECLSSFYVPVYAQGVPVDLNSITITQSSDNPAPGQNVTVKVESYSFNIDTATVIWTVNGKEVEKGIGKTSINVQAPDLGKKSKIEVTAISTNGSRYTNSVTIGSGSIDIIKETDGYTTPFFKGKIPFVFQNTIKVIAIPHLASGSGKEFDPSTLIYEWKKDDGTVLQSQSGYGKQAILLKGNIVPRPYYLIVTVSTRDGSAQAQTLTQIVPTSPVTNFYVNDPLYGPLFNKAIGDVLYLGNNKEVSIFASLFGSNIISDSDPALSWFINNTEHQDLSKNKSVVFRVPDNTSGNSKVELKTQSTQNILQRSDSSFTILFDASKSATSPNGPVTF